MPQPNPPSFKRVHQGLRIGKMEATAVSDFDGKFEARKRVSACTSVAFLAFDVLRPRYYVVWALHTFLL